MIKPWKNAFACSCALFVSACMHPAAPLVLTLGTLPTTDQWTYRAIPTEGHIPDAGADRVLRYLPGGVAVQGETSEYILEYSHVIRDARIDVRTNFKPQESTAQLGSGVKARHRHRSGAKGLVEIIGLKISHSPDGHEIYEAVVSQAFRPNSKKPGEPLADALCRVLGGSAERAHLR